MKIPPVSSIQNDNRQLSTSDHLYACGPPPAQSVPPSSGATHTRDAGLAHPASPPCASFAVVATSQSINADPVRGRGRQSNMCDDHNTIYSFIYSSFCFQSKKQTQVKSDINISVVSPIAWPCMHECQDDEWLRVFGMVDVMWCWTKKSGDGAEVNGK